MTQVPSLSQTSTSQDTAATGFPVSSSPTLRRSRNPVTAKIRSIFAGRSLRQQLLTAVIPIALLPLVVESIVNYSLNTNRTRSEANSTLQGQALLASETVSGNLLEEVNFARLFTQNPLILDKVRRDRNLAAAENLPQIPKERLEPRFILNKQLAPNPIFNEYLAQTAESRDFAEIIVTEANGFNVGYSAITSDFVQKGETWWETAKTEDVWFSDPGYDSTTFRVGIDLSHVIRDPKTDEFLGVAKFFVTALAFDQLNDYLANAGIQGSQQVQLLDTSAKYILANFTEEGQELALTPKSLTLVGGDVVNDIATRVAEAKSAEQIPDNSILQQQLQSAFPVNNLQVTSTGFVNEGATRPENLVVTFGYEGKQYSVATVPQLDWVAIASMDASEIRAAGQKSLVIALFLILALGGAAIALTGVMSRQISLPLDDLATKAGAVSQGNLNVRAEPTGSAETRTLANTFNDLVRRIRGFIQEQTLNTRQATLSAEVASAKVVTSAELLPIYDRLIAEARDILGTDRAVVYQFNPDWSGTIVSESVASTLPSAYEQELSDACIPMETLEKYRSQGHLVENNVATASFHPEHLALLSNLKVKSVLGVPIVSQGQLFGLLITHHCHNAHQWQASEVDLLKQLGLQLGLVIERVQLLEKTQTLATEQQQIKEGLQRNALQLLMDVDPVREGDLTVRAKVTEDEIGTVADSYNATIASLRKIVTKVQEAAQQVSSTTDVNQPLIQTLSASAAQQAEEILTAQERVQTMAQSVRQVSTSAEKAEIAVRQAAETVSQGDDAMNRTVEGIMAIRETVADTAKKVKRLGESSQKISNVVNLISGFAAQTNMLALNASIEASRAGESGKGFAVVAEEVRELARQSAEATTEIEKLVASIQTETNAVVTAMESGTEQVVTGTQLVDETRQSLNKITAASREISDLVVSITQATTEQSQVSEVVTHTMTSVAANASQNSTSASQVSKSFEQLLSVAQALQDEVGRFKMS
ncbi:methyl-accepting chemotaxis protein [Oscillatoria sp. CS-180]|uniref:methyl-accepting chemotaxis protein n=1 Tax=Oscillatoria sp. CS-180 TaxID=3021720 RepID=UPI00232E955D|nr:methyl-accepting chemotaxis protein [Oscillatoria sp. CS-180]MDB9528783.1 methyl-accepting chemotaxis protein [Oscillatoria sp. CS-180]